MSLICLMQTPPTTPMPPMPPDMDQVMVHQMGWWETLPSQAQVLIALVMIAGMFLVSWPIVRAVARRIEGKTHEDPALRGDVEQLRARLAELETLQTRLSDLEERVDFTERMLAQQKGIGQLPAH